MFLLGQIMLIASIMNIENLEKEANEMMEEEKETFAVKAPGAKDKGYKEDKEGEQVKPAECLVALSTVRKFCQAIHSGTGDLHSVLLHIENDCIHTMYEGKKQAKITDFFSKGCNLV